MGNGPSLRGFDFSRLSRFDVFGMNAAYRYWYEINWFPQYYSCLDLVLGMSHRDAIIELIRNSEQLGIRAFLLRQTLIDTLGELGDTSKVVNFDLLRPGFECWEAGPVTTGSHTCAWAALLGYRDIYLLGIDCNYVEMVPNAELRDGSVLEITADAPNPNYFFDSYQQKGDKYNIPNPRKDLHLQSWRNVGVTLPPQSRVLNANLISKVDAFPFVVFADIERAGSVPVYSPEQVMGGSPLNATDDFVSVPSPHPTAHRSIAAAPRIKQLRSIVACDARWHEGDATEEHAYEQAIRFLPDLPGIVYFAFPWATLFDRMEEGQSDAEELRQALTSAIPLLRDQKFVITVCQDPRMQKYRQFFAEANVAQIFWSHAVAGQDYPKAFRQIKVSPFPCYPPQAAQNGQPGNTGRKYLYTFIELREPELQVTPTRRMIIAHLSKNKRGLIILREQWDFAACPPSSTIEYQRLLQQSLFSLCPSNPTPNSVWLWETIGSGAIPVIFADSFFLPGSLALWEEAVILCPERHDDLHALSARLEALARDQELLERKRHALRQLWLFYGPETFIYDIEKRFLSLAEEQVEVDLVWPAAYGKLFCLAAEINRGTEVARSVADIFILGCSSRVLTDLSGFQARFQVDTELREAFRRAVTSCHSLYATSALELFARKKIAWEEVA